MKWVCALLLFAGQAFAEPTLTGRIVTFQALAYDDPAAPIYAGPTTTVVVDDGVEFGLNPEGGLTVDVVPAIVDISANRISVRTTDGPGQYLRAAFNGFVLEFTTDCALFDAVAIDRKGTTYPIKQTDIDVAGGVLRVNLSGLDYEIGSMVTLNLQVADCPLS
ncbi:MAG: hypothetical protein ACRCS3_09650 [Paracoccaceae bacterium]